MWGAYPIGSSPWGDAESAPTGDRALTPYMVSALEDVVVRPVLLYQQQFRTGIGYLWTGIGTLDWDGKAWIGVGNMIDFSPVEESDEIKANGISISLSGVRTQDIAQALSEMGRKLPGRIWLALMDEAGQVIPDPKIMFRGLTSAVLVDDGAETAKIAVTVEDELIDFEQPRERRYTDADQRRRDPNDGFFKNVAALQDVDVPWGARS